MSKHEKSEAQIQRELEALELAKKKRYEQRDINIPMLAKVITGFFLSSLVMVGLATLSMFAVYKYVSRVDRTPTSPGMNQALSIKPPLAPLQSGTEAKKDIADLRHQEEAKTTIYAQHEGRTQIPVDRAIEIVAERGLEQAAPQPSGMPAAEQPVSTGTPTETPTSVTPQ